MRYDLTDFEWSQRQNDRAELSSVAAGLPAFTAEAMVEPPNEP